MMKSGHIIYLVSLVLVIVGALNWGLVALDKDYNAVEKVVGVDNAQYVYYIVAAAAVVVAVANVKHFKSLF